MLSAVGVVLRAQRKTRDPRVVPAHSGLSINAVSVSLQKYFGARVIHCTPFPTTKTCEQTQALLRFCVASWRPYIGGLVARPACDGMSISMCDVGALFAVTNPIRFPALVTSEMTSAFPCRRSAFVRAPRSTMWPKANKASEKAVASWFWRSRRSESKGGSVFLS